MASPAQLLPWGRLRLTSKPSEEIVESDNIELSRSQHRIGREATRCDHIIRKNYISGLHCIVTRQGKHSNGDPVVFIEDLSRFGTFVNGQLVGRRKKVPLRPGMSVQFTIPGSADVTPLVYMFELNPSGLTEANELLHQELSANDQGISGRLRKRTREEPDPEPTQPVSATGATRPSKQIRHRAGSKGKQSTTQQSSSSAADPSQASLASVPSAKTAAKKRRRGDATPGDDTNRDFKLKLLKIQSDYDAMEAKRIARDHELKEARQKLQECDQQLEAQKRTVEATKTENLRLQKALKAKVEECDRLAADLTEARAVPRGSNAAHAAALKATTELADARHTHQQELATRDLENRRLSNKCHDLQHMLDVSNQKAAARPRTPSPAKVPKAVADKIRSYASLHRSNTNSRLKEDEKIEELCQFIEAIEKNQVELASGRRQTPDSQESDAAKAARRVSQGSTASWTHTEPSPPEIPASQDTQNSQSQDTTTGQAVEARRQRTFYRSGVAGSTKVVNTSGRVPQLNDAVQEEEKREDKEEKEEKEESQDP